MPPLAILQYLAIAPLKKKQSNSLKMSPLALHNLRLPTLIFSPSKICNVNIFLPPIFKTVKQLVLFKIFFFTIFGHVAAQSSIFLWVHLTGYLRDSDLMCVRQFENYFFYETSQSDST